MQTARQKLRRLPASGAGLRRAAQTKRKRRPRPAGQIRPRAPHPGDGCPLPLPQQGHFHLCPGSGREAHLRHLCGPHPQSAARGELPAGRRSAGQGATGCPGGGQSLPLPALQRGPRHRPAPSLSTPSGRCHRAGDGGTGHGPARSARCQELRPLSLGRSRNARRPCDHRGAELQPPPDQRCAGRGRKSAVRQGLHSSTRSTRCRRRCSTDWPWMPPA